MADFPVLLTFDDGPHQVKGNDNRTIKVLNVLQAQAVALGHPLSVVFFVQTHSEDADGRPIRLNSPRGAEVAKQAVNAGHVLQIHSGSTKDHASHVARARRRPTTSITISSQTARTGLSLTCCGQSAPSAPLPAQRRNTCGRRIWPATPPWTPPTIGSD